jgi:hypothetical protein
MFAKLFQLVSTLVSAQTAIQGMQVRVQDAAKRSIVFLLAGVLALGALGFFIAAVWLWLAGLYGAVVANIVIGGGLLLVALILAAVAFNLGKSHQSPPPNIAAGDASAQLGELLAEFETLVKEDASSLKAVAAAALVGIVLAKLLGR